MTKTNLIYLLSLNFSAGCQAQSFLHTSGKYIYNGSGEEVILCGPGTGNWLLQEGYMMQSTGVADAMYQYREKLIETIGEARTAFLYETWLNNHFTRQDVDVGGNNIF